MIFEKYFFEKHIFFIFFSPKLIFEKHRKIEKKNGKFCFSKNIFSKKHFFPVQLSQSECRIRLYSPWTSQNQRGSSRIKRNQTNERVKNDQIHQKIDLGAVLALEAKRRVRAPQKTVTTKLHQKQKFRQSYGKSICLPYQSRLDAQCTELNRIQPQSTERTSLQKKSKKSKKLKKLKKNRFWRPLGPDVSQKTLTGFRRSDKF